MVGLVQQTFFTYLANRKLCFLHLHNQASLFYVNVSPLVLPWMRQLYRDAICELRFFHVFASKIYRMLGQTERWKGLLLLEVGEKQLKIAVFVWMSFLLWYVVSTPMATNRDTTTTIILSLVDMTSQHSCLLVSCFVRVGEFRWAIFGQWKPQENQSDQVQVRHALKALCSRSIELNGSDNGNRLLVVAIY